MNNACNAIYPDKKLKAVATKKDIKNTTQKIEIVTKRNEQIMQESQNMKAENYNLNKGIASLERDFRQKI